MSKLDGSQASITTTENRYLLLSYRNFNCQIYVIIQHMERELEYPHSASYTDNLVTR